MKTILLTLGGVVFFIGGIVILFIVFPTEIKKTEVKKKWIKHSAIVTGLMVDESPIYNDSTGRYEFFQKTCYEYMIDGKAHSGFSSISYAKTQQSLGQTITIRVNPLNPEQSDVNDAFIFYIPWFYFVAGLGFFLVSMYIFTVLIKQISLL